MLQYASNAIEFVRDVSFEDFAADKLRYFAVMKNVEIVGEAANMLTKDFCAFHPDLPWTQITGMRHVLVHGYAQVSDIKLWRTAKKDLPTLCDAIQKLLAETDWQQWEQQELQA